MFKGLHNLANPKLPPHLGAICLIVTWQQIAGFLSLPPFGLNLTSFHVAFLLHSPSIGPWRTGIGPQCNVGSVTKDVLGHVRLGGLLCPALVTPLI